MTLLYRVFAWNCRQTVWRIAVDCSSRQRELWHSQTLQTDLNIANKYCTFMFNALRRRCTFSIDCSVNIFMSICHSKINVILSRNNMILVIIIPFLIALAQFLQAIFTFSKTLSTNRQKSNISACFQLC